jgi:vitamin B12 transporter
VKRVLKHIVLGMCISPWWLLAQSDSARVLNEVTISTNLVGNYATGTYQREINKETQKAFQFNNLGEMLSQSNLMAIKSYGLGAIASTSARGGSANQTVFLWDGININSPMLGQYDVSLLPVNMFGNYAFQSGSQASIWGSGAVGAAIHLQDNLLFNRGLQTSIGYSYGSFNNNNSFGKISYSNEKIATQAVFYGNNALNNFTFTHPESKQIIRQKNAELNQLGGKFNLAYKLKTNQLIEFKTWIGDSHRAIAPTVYQANNNAALADKFIRSVVSYSVMKNKSNYTFKNAFFTENTNYTFLQTQSESRAINALSQLETEHNLSDNTQLYTGHNIQNIKGFSENYLANSKQLKLATWHALKHQLFNQKLVLQYSGRQEYLANNSIPYVPSFGFSAPLYKDFLQIGGSINRSFRLPTLNDLFWNPGGNLDLKPESGWGQELNYKIQYKLNNILLVNRLSIFSKRINNWIMWQPLNGVWSPQNLLYVWSRGIESDNSLQFSIFKNHQIKLGLFTNYVISTNEKSAKTNDESVGKQLIYVPMYSGSFSVDYNVKSTGVRLVKNYTGYRYTATDHSRYLLPFSLTDLVVFQHFTLNKNTIELQIMANNLMNINYTVVAANPMPGRNFRIGLVWKLN